MEENTRIYRWKVHPAAVSPLKTISVLIVTAACAVLSYQFTGSLFMSAMAVILLCGSLIQFFAPTYYTLDDKKVEIKILFKTRTEPLSKFKKYIKDDNGIFLSSEPESKILDQFRGLFLLAGPEEREAIINILKGVFDNEPGIH